MAPSKHSPVAKRIAALCISLVIAIVLVELVAQGFAFAMRGRWKRLEERPQFVYERSDDPRLAYELARDFRRIIEGRLIRMNAHGIRHDRDEVTEGALRVALLGDSVVFGDHAQHRTLSSLLQGELDPEARDIVVLNFGVPGYNAAEIAAFMENKDAIYDVDEVCYLLNLNDFARRGTITEMGGMYRKYYRPVLQSPWMARKAIYRIVRLRMGGGAGTVPTPFYEWIFEREHEAAFEEIRGMAAYAAENEVDFSVIILPAGNAYQDGEYQLRAVHEQIVAFLREERIRYCNPIERFAVNPPEYFDGTDHLTDRGNVVMVDVMEKFRRGRRTD